MTEAAFPHIQVIDPQSRKPNLLNLPIGLTATGLRDGALKAGSSAEGQSLGFQANKHGAVAGYFIVLKDSLKSKDSTAPFQTVQSTEPSSFLPHSVKW